MSDQQTTEPASQEPAAPPAQQPDGMKQPEGRRLPPTVVRTHITVAPIIPTNTQEVAAMARAICDSGVVPESYQNKDGSPNKGLVAMGIMRGLEVGFAPMTALQWVMPVNGRFSIWGDGAIAILFERKVLKSQRIVWTDGTTIKNSQDVDVLVEYEAPPTAGLPRDRYPDTLQCNVYLTRDDGEVFTGRFSVMDARIAGLWSDTRRQPWQRYPGRMLMNRARAFAIRDGFANHLNGLYIREEAEDMPPVKGFEVEAVDTTQLRGAVSAITDQTQEVQGSASDQPTAEVIVVTPQEEPKPETAAPEPVVIDDDRDERLLMKRILNADTLEQIDEAIAADGPALDFWRTGQPERYARIMEQITARREAKSK